MGQGQMGQKVQPKGHYIGRWAHVNVKLHFFFMYQFEGQDQGQQGHKCINSCFQPCNVSEKMIQGQCQEDQGIKV